MGRNTRIKPYQQTLEPYKNKMEIQDINPLEIKQLLQTLQFLEQCETKILIETRLKNDKEPERGYYHAAIIQNHQNLQEIIIDQQNQINRLHEKLDQPKPSKQYNLVYPSNQISDCQDIMLALKTQTDK